MGNVTVVLVDIGNTRTKLAFSDGESLLSVTELPTGEFDSHLLSKPMDAWVLSSVVPAVGTMWTELLSRKASGLTLKEVDNFDIIFDVRRKTEVGEDRLADIEGAFYLGLKPPFITIDFGTASVINLVTPQHEFVGGVIGPGVMSSYECLTSKAALLKEVPLDVPEDLIGRDTKTNLESGFILGFAFWAEGFYVRLKKQYPDLSAVLTGGAAKIIHQVIDFPAQYEPHLSLLGLLRVLELNKHLL